MTCGSPFGSGTPLAPAPSSHPPRPRRARARLTAAPPSSCTSSTALARRPSSARSKELTHLFSWQQGEHVDLKLSNDSQVVPRPHWTRHRPSAPTKRLSTSQLPGLGSASTKLLPLLDAGMISHHQISTNRPLAGARRQGLPPAPEVEQAGYEEHNVVRTTYVTR